MTLTHSLGNAADCYAESVKVVQEGHRRMLERRTNDVN